jgi:hypothetical protein
MTATSGTPAGDLRAWFEARLPGEWASPNPEITVDREEITVVVTVPAPAADTADGADSAEQAASAGEAGRIARWRADTREQRMQIAREAEHRFGRKVAWGAVCGDSRELFTSLSVPVMTRLRQADRVVLDTLVDAGVARSRSHALAWCVRLVGQHSSDWLAGLRDALQAVERLRDAGPTGAGG